MLCCTTWTQILFIFTLYLLFIYYLSCSSTTMMNLVLTVCIDYLPSFGFRPCAWEEHIVNVTGATSHGECVNRQPQFNTTVALLIALVSGVAASVSTAIFASVFDILNVKNLDELEGYEESTNHKLTKVMPFSEDAHMKIGRFYLCPNNSRYYHHSQFISTRYRTTKSSLSK